MRSLTFHEQADGRKVARLPGGKVVLLDIHQVDRVPLRPASRRSDVSSRAARTGLMRSAAGAEADDLSAAACQTPSGGNLDRW